MTTYKYNPDSHKVHNIPNKTDQCNFPIMDGDETNFLASNNIEAVKIAKDRFSIYASKCQHCM